MVQDSEKVKQDSKVTTSRFSKFSNYFNFNEYNTDMESEIIGGVTTFLTMSYIIVVNPAIMTAIPGENGKPGIAIPGYTPVQVQQMLAVVTILAATVAIFVMAFYANRPFALAPGLSLNTFFAFTVIGALGIPWQTALAAVVTEGIIFLILTLVGARSYIINLLPQPVKFAFGTGIGLFLALIGVREMQVVVADPSTFVSLGNIATNPVALLAIVGFFITAGLYARGTTGSIIIGIILTTILGYLATIAGLVPAGVLIPESLPSAQYDIRPLVGAFLQGFKNVDSLAFSLVVFTFFFVDFFETAGTLTGVGQAAGFLNEKGDLPDQTKPLTADAIGTTVGGMLGTSTITTYVESATGIEAGGRTGMTAFVVGLLFLASLVVVPLAAAIPLYASHIALVIVAILMMKNVTDINWDDPTHAVPAGLTILVMPLTFSIAYGIAAGTISYPIVKSAANRYGEVRTGQWLLAGAFLIYFFVRTSNVLQSVV